ncbi:CynX/NimT family MFS transporter [Ferviditalea candida]|uniref:MFS transporter n=1 Tax=Ferviditalea candida TaxID=3108399 RepID=A0ABU5ZI36_9BACL|nr:MFS transporter [Paenibacillaceae bacterium T2]
MSKNVETTKSRLAIPSTTGILFTVFVIIFIAANLRAPITSVGPLIGLIREGTGISGTLAGLLTTIPLTAFALISPLAPIIARRIGIERTLFLGMILLTMGILVRYIPTIPGLLLGTSMMGIAIALSNVLLPSLIKRDFPERSGLMTGIFSFMLNLSAALGFGISIPLALKADLGWRGSLVSWAILSVAAIFILLPLLRNKRKPAVSFAGTASLFSAQLWKSSIAWQVTLFMGLQSLLFYVIAAWLPEMLQEQGLSISESGWMLSILQFSAIPSAFVMPILAVRASDQRLLGAIIGLLLLTGFVGLTIGGVGLVLLWMFFLGIGGGSAISLALLLFSLRTRNALQAAELSGMAQSVGYLLSAVGPILFGFIYDLTHQWLIPEIILIAVSVLVVIFGIGAGQQKYVTPDEQVSDNSIT